MGCEGAFDDTKTDARRPEHFARFSRNLASGSGRRGQRSKYRKPDDLVFTNERRPYAPAQLAASAPEPHGQEVWLAGDCGLSELSHDAFEPDEQRWRPARSNP